MKRSSSIQPVNGNVHIPTKYIDKFNKEKNHILQRIREMLLNNTKPISLLLISPKNSNDYEIQKKRMSQSRRDTNLKLMESQRRHARCLQIASAVDKLYHSSSNGLNNAFSLNTQNININQKYVSPIINKSNYSLPRKYSAFNTIDSANYTPSSRNIALTSRNTANKHQSNIGLFIQSPKVVLCNRLENLLRIKPPVDLQSLSNNKRAIIHRGTKIVFNARPSSTVDSRNMHIKKCKTGVRRTSMPKLKKIDECSNDVGGWLLETNVGKEMINNVAKPRIKKAIDDMPLTAWGIEDKF